jgi:hypothetical protein
MKFAAALALSLASARTTPTLAKRTLSVRGGAWNPEAVATGATYLAATNAGMMALAPSKAGEIYGVESNALTTWLAEGMGFLFAAGATLAFCLLNGVDGLKAIGYGYIPLVVNDASGILNNKHGELGMPNFGPYLVAAIDIGVMLAILLGADFANNAAYVGSFWMLLNSIPMYLMPTKFTEMWGLTTKGGVEEVMCKGIAMSMGAFAISSLAVLQGTEATKAIAYGWLPPLASVFDNLFVSKHVSALGLDAGPQYFWLAIQAAVVAAILS